MSLQTTIAAISKIILASKRKGGGDRQLFILLFTLAKNYVSTIIDLHKKKFIKIKIIKTDKKNFF